MIEVRELVLVEVTTPVRYLKYLVNVHLFAAEQRRDVLPAAVEEVFKKLEGAIVVDKVSARFADYDSTVSLSKIIDLLMGESVAFIESINRLED